MPNKETVKTKSTRKRVYILACILGAGLLFLFISRHLAGEGRPTVILNGYGYNVALAKTPGQLQRGLAGSTLLQSNEGMLFEFAEEGQQCFWMKGMLFPIDIIWIDAHKKITAVHEHATPQDYPQQYCHQGRYVLEVNAGDVELRNVRVGDTLSF